MATTTIHGGIVPCPAQIILRAVASIPSTHHCHSHHTLSAPAGHQQDSSVEHRASRTRKQHRNVCPGHSLLPNLDVWTCIKSPIQTSPLLLCPPFRSTTRASPGGQIMQLSDPFSSTLADTQTEGTTPPHPQPSTGQRASSLLLQAPGFLRGGNATPPPSALSEL